MGFFVRMWEPVSSVVMTYIEKSSEKLLGKTQQIWWRNEFQTTQGNLPHIHCLLWTDENKDTGTFEDRIVAQKPLLRFNFEFQKFRRIGLHTDKADAFYCYKKAIKNTTFVLQRTTDITGALIPSLPAEHDLLSFRNRSEPFTRSFPNTGQKWVGKKEGFHDTLTVTEKSQAGKWFNPCQKWKRDRHESTSVCFDRLSRKFADLRQVPVGSLYCEICCWCWGKSKGFDFSW